MSDADNLYSILSTTRSIRRISDKPVDDATLERVLQAAIWAQVVATDNHGASLQYVIAR